MQELTKSQSFVSPAFKENPGDTDHKPLPSVPALPLLNMGDPFSADNISLFERQTSHPKKPNQAYLPDQRASSSTAAEELCEKYPMSQDNEFGSTDLLGYKSELAMDKVPAKAFEFEVSTGPRFRRMHLVILGLLLLCVIVLAATLGVEMHHRPDKHGDSAGVDAVPVSDNTTAAPVMSLEKSSSSIQLLTTSSTLTSGFLTVTVGVTSTLYPTPANSRSPQSTSLSSHVNLPIQLSSESPITLTYSLSAPPEIIISPTPASASASNSALPDWLGNLVTGKRSAKSTEKTAL